MSNTKTIATKIGWYGLDNAIGPSVTMSPTATISPGFGNNERRA